MNTSRLNSPYEHLKGEGDDLGDGLFSAELYFWAGRKRQQNMPHAEAGHKMCQTCKNCLCSASFSPDFGFKCMCEYGKTMVTPYKIRFQRSSDKEHAAKGHIYCLNHRIYEAKGASHDAK